MPIDLIHKAIAEAKTRLAGQGVDKADMKSKARTLKTVVKELASEAHVNLNEE
jgi:hypothetical protein